MKAKVYNRKYLTIMKVKLYRRTMWKQNDYSVI